ncbi:alpha/beta fold hydrolase [Paenibacillus flagellatus]|uniref:Alpha/beta hydrolase n=1 Tax=Paenibacillus flagellatus TaxID=2211139 RepID=A0A2V5JX62_9BACL|nr:alpha/beta hydrolase [Paenibacillus flagellatus]PYI51358.1 alpha/beta hydrolase [Paenibacillus flagellatus]
MTYLSTFKSKPHADRFLEAYDRTLSLWNVAHASVYVPTDYGTTHVLVAGPVDGEPLVLLHGFGFGATMWYANVEALSAEFRVYAVDVIGEFNRSEVAAHFREKSDYADWLSQLLDRLHIEKAAFLGHSNGGWHILNYAMQVPHRVTKMVLLAPAASFAPFRKQFGLRLLAANLIKTRPVIIGYCAKWFVGKGNTVNDYLFEQFYHGLKGFAWKYKILIPSVFSDEELERIRVSGLMLIGDREVIYDAGSVFARARAKLPLLETMTIPGAGHALPIERSELVNERALQFLRS